MRWTGSSPVSGVGLVLVAIGSVQLGAAVATQLFPLTGAGGAVWLRLLLSAALLAVVWPPTRLRSAPWRWGWSRSAWISVAAFGAVLATMNWSFYESIARIPLGVAVTLEFLGPLGLAVALSRRVVDAALAVVALAGVVALTVGEDTARLSGGRLDPVGVGLALVAGALWAGYILLSGRVGRLVPGTRGLTVALVLGAVALAPLGLGLGALVLRPRVLLLAGAVAVLSTALAYGLELEALRRLPARLFGVLMSVEPAVAALVGFLLLGQRLGLLQWAGISAVSLASLAATATSTRPPPRD